MTEHLNIIVSKRLVAINSASSVAARILNITVLLWMYQYLLNRIPAEEFAVYPVVTAAMVFAPLFFSFFTSSISRYVIDAYARGDFEEVSRIVSSILPILASAAVVFLLAGSVFALNIDHILNIVPRMVDDAQIMMSLLIASFVLQMVFLPFVTGYQVRQRYVELNLLRVFRDLARIALLTFFILEFGPAVIWVVVATVIAEIFHLYVTVVRSRRMVPELRFERNLFVFHKARVLMSFGMWTTLGRLGGTMYTNGATIMLNLYGGAVDVTSYHIGSTFFRQLQGAVGIAAQPVAPTLTAMNALEDRQRLSRTVLRGGRYALWVSMLIAAPLALYAETFIDLYVGDEYAVAATVILLFMVIFPFDQATALLGLTAMATAQVRAFFLPAFLFQFLGLVLMIVLVADQGFGAVGATGALTVITIGSQLVYFWGLSLRLANVGFAIFVRKVLIPGWEIGRAHV